MKTLHEVMGLGPWRPTSTRLSPEQDSLMERCRQYPGYYARCVGINNGILNYVNKNLFVYELLDTKGIAFIADDSRVMTRGEIFTTIFGERKAPWIDDIVLLEEAPESAGKVIPDEPAGGPVSRATIVNESNSFVEVDVEAAQETLLVLSMPYYDSGQSAMVNGKSAPIMRAYGGFTAIEVPRGKSRVVMRYVPYDVIWGFILAFLTYVLGWFFVSGRGRDSTVY